MHESVYRAPHPSTHYESPSSFLLQETLRTWRHRSCCGRNARTSGPRFAECAVTSRIGSAMRLVLTSDTAPRRPCRMDFVTVSLACNMWFLFWDLRRARVVASSTFHGRREGQNATLTKTKHTPSCFHLTSTWHSPRFSVHLHVRYVQAALNISALNSLMQNTKITDELTVFRMFIDPP